MSRYPAGNARRIKRGPAHIENRRLLVYGFSVLHGSGGGRFLQEFNCRRSPLLWTTLRRPHQRPVLTFLYEQSKKP
jgi:hypothetical protein